MPGFPERALATQRLSLGGHKGGGSCRGRKPKSTDTWRVSAWRRRVLSQAKKPAPLSLPWRKVGFAWPRSRTTRTTTTFQLHGRIHSVRQPNNSSRSSRKKKRIMTSEALPPCLHLAGLTRGCWPVRAPKRREDQKLRLAGSFGTAAGAIEDRVHVGESRVFGLCASCTRSSAGRLPGHRDETIALG